ncbi:MAG: hypothetical protein ACTS6G_00335 [Candidatus Hodgkinia cicadicola]
MKCCGNVNMILFRAKRGSKALNRRVNLFTLNTSLALTLLIAKCFAWRLNEHLIIGVINADST